MALSAEELLELKKALDTPGAINDDAYRSWALEQVRAAEDQQLGGWAGAGGTRADSAATVPGSLGLKGIIGQEQTPEAEAEGIAGQLDPRFDLMPQVLALQPATTDPDGDEAAEQKAKSGQAGNNVGFAYEPPVSLVQKQLIENPAFLRAIRPSSPPSLDEIGAMNETSPIYQDAANYMWRQTAEAAAKSGRTVYRYSQTPWLWGDEGKGVVDQLRLKVSGYPLADVGTSFVMGVDDIAALGAGRAAMETVTPETQMHVGEGTDYMGVNEAVPQQTEDLNRWNIEQHPIAHGLGQLYGLTRRWGVADALFRGVTGSGNYVANAIAKTRLGAAAGAVPGVAPVAKAGQAAATGGAAAGLEAAGQEAVDIGADTIQSRQAPSLDRLAEAGERVRDAGIAGAEFGAGGSVIQQGARAGAEAIRDSERFQGKVRRTEPNLEWRVGRAPRVSGETKALVKQARREGVEPGDLIAEEIAPAIRDQAAQNSGVARSRAEAVRRGHYQSREGAAYEPVARLQERTLERVRDHYRPEPNGTLRAVDDKGKGYRKLFSNIAGDVSLEATKGAAKLTPQEAEQLLDPQRRRRLLADDLEAAAARRKATPVDRKAYLEKQDPKKRDAIEREVDQEIDDLLPVDEEGASLTMDERTKAYKAAEQQVLRDRVDQQEVLEPFGGSLSEYLRQRGIGAVYVSPRAMDARGLDTLIKGIDDPDLAEAARVDRGRRSAGGQKGGYDRLLKKQDEAVGKAEKIEKRVAPGGDAFRPVASLGESRRGEKALLDDTRALADQAGVREQLDQLRGLQDTLEMQNRARFRGRAGQSRELFNPQNQVDAAQLRAFPALRMLEGPLGPLGGGMAGRAALVGRDEFVQQPSESSSRGRYEAARERRLAELQRERDEEKEKREKRRQRRAAGR